MPTNHFITLDQILSMLVRASTTECTCGNGACFECKGSGVVPSYLVVLEEAEEGAPCRTCQGSCKCTFCSGSGVLVAEPGSAPVVASVMTAVVHRMAIARASEDYALLNETLDWGEAFAATLVADERIDPGAALQSTIERATHGTELLERLSRESSDEPPPAGALSQEDLIELGVLDEG